MKVLVTSASSGIGKIVVAALDGHDVRQADASPGPGPGAARAAELGHDEGTDNLVKGMEAIVHVGYSDPSAGPAWQHQADSTTLLDYYGRRTYNLLWAAAAAKVGRCIFISTMKLFRDYEENLTITERWRARPPSNDVQLLACHIGENVCKEFARDRMIKAVNLRLGWPLVSGAGAQAERSGGSAALATDDFKKVISSALTADIEQWQDVHLQSPVNGQRFLLHAATRLFSFPSAPPPPHPAVPAQARRRTSARGGRR